MNPGLYEEITFLLKRKIAQIVFELNVHKKTILNFYQTPVGFTSSNKTTYNDKGSESAPITNVDDKRQITATFCVSLSGEFLLIQLI